MQPSIEKRYPISGTRKIDYGAVHHYPDTVWEWKTINTPKSWAALTPELCSLCSLTPRSIVHYEIVHEGQTVTGTFYVEMMKRFKGRVNRLRPGIAINWKLHKDNAPSPPLRSEWLLGQERLSKLQKITTYCPDLYRANLFLFPESRQLSKVTDLGP